MTATIHRVDFGEFPLIDEEGKPVEGKTEIRMDVTDLSSVPDKKFIRDAEDLKKTAPNDTLKAFYQKIYSVLGNSPEGSTTNSNATSLLAKEASGLSYVMDHTNPTTLFVKTQGIHTYFFTGRAIEELCKRIQVIRKGMLDYEGLKDPCTIRESATTEVRQDFKV